MPCGENPLADYPTGDFCRCAKDLKPTLKGGYNEAAVMELNTRQAAFVASEMEKVENSDTRLSSEQVEARRIREEVEAALTE